MNPLHRVRRWLEARTPPANTYPASEHSIPHPMVDHPSLYGQALGEATIAQCYGDPDEGEIVRIIRADREASEQRTPQDRERQADVRRRAGLEMGYHMGSDGGADA